MTDTRFIIHALHTDSFQNITAKTLTHPQPSSQVIMSSLYSQSSSGQCQGNQGVMGCTGEVRHGVYWRGAPWSRPPSGGITLFSVHRLAEGEGEGGSGGGGSAKIMMRIPSCSGECRPPDLPLGTGKPTALGHCGRDQHV